MNQNNSNNVSNVDEFIIEAPEDNPNYDAYDNLIKVLENDIRKAHNNSLQVESTLVTIRNSAYERPGAGNPQAEHLSLLYCHISEEMKSQKQKVEAKLSSLNYQEQDDDDNSDNVSLLDDTVPFYLYSGSSKQIVGSKEALSRNVFYSRALTTLFSFLAFVIMSCVPHIGWRYVDPRYLLELGCPYKGYYEGEFSYISFHYIIALSVIVFLHNALWIGYYILPVDSDGRKYVPGMRHAFDSFLNPSDVTTYGRTTGDFLHTYAKSLEPILDGGYLVMLTIACIIASMNLERGVAFYNTYEADALSVYFSIVSYLETFEHTDDCLQSNPLGLFKASLTFSFLAAFCLAFTFQITFRSYLLEKKKEKLTGGGQGPLSSKQLPDDSDDRSHTLLANSSHHNDGDSKKYIRV